MSDSHFGHSSSIQATVRILRAEGSAVRREAIVSAIVANFNGANHLEVCLPSLQAQSYPAMEIIVSDNGSTDASETIARKHGARWHCTGQNRGLAPALNFGARAAQGEFFLFLNNDMRFHPDFVRHLVEELIRDPETFAADAVQFNWQGDQQVHLLTRLTKRANQGSMSMRLLPGLYTHQEAPETVAPSFMASAANMMARRSMFEALGGFDERLPLGYEDVELCWRAWTRRWKTVFVPAAVCWHHVSASSRSAVARRMGYRGVIKGRLLLATKLLPFRYAIAAWSVTAAGLGKELATVQGRRSLDRMQILGEYVRRLPALIRERRSVFRSADTTAEKVLDQLLQIA